MTNLILALGSNRVDGNCSLQSIVGLEGNWIQVQENKLLRHWRKLHLLLHVRNAT